MIGLDNEPLNGNTGPVDDLQTAWQPVGQVVGENVRRLRENAGLTQNEAARLFQECGLPWTRSHLAGLEAGNRETIDVSTLVLLARALQVALSELFAGEGHVRLSDEAVWTRKALRELHCGQHTEEAITLEGVALQKWTTSIGGTYAIVGPEGQPFQADTELAARLGLAPDVVYRAARKLWGHTLHEERDRRIAALGELTAAERRARRGHTTRQLAREIQPHLMPSNDG